MALSQEMQLYIQDLNSRLPQPLVNAEAVVEQQFRRLGYTPETLTLAEVQQNAGAIEQQLAQGRDVPDDPHVVQPTGQPVLAGMLPGSSQAVEDVDGEPAAKVLDEFGGVIQNATATQKEQHVTQSSDPQRDEFGGLIVGDAPAEEPQSKLLSERQALQLPEFGSIEGNDALFGSQLGDEGTSTMQLVRDAAAGLFTLNPKSRISGIEKRFPELDVQRIGEDNAVITHPDGGQAVVNAGDLSNADLAPYIGYAIASLPAAKFASGAKSFGSTLLKMMGGEMVTDAALQGAERLQGGEEDFDTKRNMIAGGGALVAGAIGKGVGGLISRNKELNNILRTNPDARVAKYVLNSRGRRVPDALAKEVIKQGFDPITVDTMKGASRLDKNKMLRMIDYVEDASRTAKSRSLNRPSNIVGDTILERYNFVKLKNSQAANRIDSVANTLRGKPISVAQFADDFLDDLRKLDIKISDDLTKIDFSKSTFRSVPKLQRSIKRVFDDMRKREKPDAYDVHVFKQSLDEFLNFKKGKKGLSGKAESVLKNLRFRTKELLEKNDFPAYNAVNRQFHDTRVAMDGFKDAMGRSIDLTSKNANVGVGAKARSLLGDNVTRGKLYSAIQDAQDVATKYGARFDDDVVTQVNFVEDLSKAFGTPAKTGVGRSIADELRLGAMTANRRDARTGMGDVAIGVITDTYRKIAGITDENAVKALRELLSR